MNHDHIPYQITITTMPSTLSSCKINITLYCINDFYLTLVVGLNMNLTLVHSEWNIFLRALTSSSHPVLFLVLTNTMALALTE